MRALPLLVAALLAGGAGQAMAQEERAVGNFAGVGVRAMGMGGAYVGVADDLTAMYWNPAGLAQIEDRETHIAFARSSHATDARGGESGASASITNTRPGSFGLVFPYPVHQGSLVLAAGFARIRDFDWTLLQRGTEDGLQANHLFRHEGGLSLTALSGAVDVSPVMSLGMTLGFVTGDDTAINQFDWTDTDDAYVGHRWLARDTFSDDYDSALYASFGVMMRTPRRRPRLRLGASVAMGTTHEITYVFTTADPLLEGYDTVIDDDGTRHTAGRQSIRDSYRLSLPMEVSLGASAEPLRGVLLAASLHLAEWEQTEYDDRDDAGLRSSLSFARQYRNLVRYHLGAEWRVPVVALDLRAGYYTDPIPFVGPRDPEAEDDAPRIDITEDRRYYSLGAGLLVDRVIQVNVAWVRGRYAQREPLSDGTRLTESGDITRWFGGLAYRF